MTLTYVDLSDLSAEDQTQIRRLFSHQRQYRSNYLLEHEWIGRKIWRPVHVAAWMGKLIKEPWDDLLIQDSLTRSEKPSPVKIFRAKQRQLDQEWIAKDADTYGIICLCFDPIPADWTYFEIVKVHFLKKSLIVRAVVGDRQELLRMF